MQIDPPSPLSIAPHALKVALLEPQIAPNTGNIARLCVATGSELHLIRPFGFVLDDRQLRRSAMDYWPRLRLTQHDDLAAFQHATASAQLWLFSSKGERSLWDVEFADGDYLLFGNETRGLPETLLAQHRGRVLRIPQAREERCLNLSTAAGIGLFEALRQVRNRAAARPS